MDNTSGQELKFHRELSELINRHSLENESNTPDYILARCLVEMLETVNYTIREREEWYGHKHEPGQATRPAPQDVPQDVDLIQKALRIAKGEEGPKTEGIYEDDARYVYPQRLRLIIESLEHLAALPQWADKPDGEGEYEVRMPITLVQCSADCSHCDNDNSGAGLLFQIGNDFHCIDQAINAKWRKLEEKP